MNADVLLGEAGTLLTHNQFAYCINSPVMFSDHNGMAIDRGDNLDIGIPATKAQKDAARKAVISNSKIQQYVKDPSEYSYVIDTDGDGKLNNGNYTYNDKKYICCAYAAYEVQGGGFLGATLRYNDGCGEKGVITNPAMLRPGMEVFQWNGNYNDNGEMIMTHAGVIMYYDFGERMELAVFHSVGAPVYPSQWKALHYYDDGGGPNITSFARRDDTTNWTHYGVPKGI